MASPVAVLWKAGPLGRIGVGGNSGCKAFAETAIFGPDLF